MTRELNDSLDDLLGRPAGETRIEPVRAPATYTARDFTETCPKCRGTGRFTSYSGRSLGQCFACKGAGKHSFKTSPETRAKARMSKVERKAADIEAYKAANPAVYAWMVDNAPTFEFAASLLAAFNQYGGLTDGQFAAVERAIVKETTRKAERAAEAAVRAEVAPVVDTAGVDRLKLAFDTAIAKASEKGLSLRTPKLTIGGIVISPAKADSKNPGALYVKTGGLYLGKITAGRFMTSRECTPEDEAKVLAFVADPKQAAEAYGQTTGVCCVCNATLTSKWKLRGIGPVCAQKFGW